MTGRTTQELVRLCLARDESAWREFLKRYSPVVRAAVKRRLAFYGLPASDTDDIAQDLFTRIWDKSLLRNVEGWEVIEYWLAMVAANFTSSHHRSKKSDVMRNSLSLHEELVRGRAESGLERFLADEKLSPMAELDLRGTRDIVEKAIESFNPKQKIVFRLYADNGSSYEEITRLTGTPLGTVSSIINRAKNKIKESLEENS